MSISDLFHLRDWLCSSHCLWQFSSVITACILWRRDCSVWWVLIERNQLNRVCVSHAGRSIDANRAYQLGLVNRVVPDDQALQAALDLAREVAQHSRAAVVLGRRGLRSQVSLFLFSANIRISIISSILIRTLLIDHRCEPAPLLALFVSRCLSVHRVFFQCRPDNTSHIAFVIPLWCTLTHSSNPCYLLVLYLWWSCCLLCFFSSAYISLIQGKLLLSRGSFSLCFLLPIYLVTQSTN